MKKYIIFLLWMTVLFIQSQAQDIQEFQCLYDDQEINLSPADEVANSVNGWFLTPRGTLRVLVIFAQINYNQNPNNDPGSSNWDQDEFPDWKDELLDPYWSVNLQGKITRYYSECSFAEYMVLGDYLASLITINESSYGGIDPYGDLAAAQVIISANSLGSLVTQNGFDIEDFDMWQNAIEAGKIKINQPDDPHSYDHVMVIFRNHNYLLGGKGSVDNGSYNLYGYGSDTRSRFGGAYGLPFNILHHEYDHMLFGSNNFHAGGGHGNTTAYLMNLQSGWSMMGGASSSLLTCNGWDRDRLGYKHPNKTMTISALDEFGLNEVNTDLDPSSIEGTHYYILRDYVTYGDVIRIKLPNIPVDKYPQWIWIENHRTITNNNSEFDQFQYQSAECVEEATPGLYSYIQIAKNIKEGPSTFSGNQEYLRFYNADGFYDILHVDTTVQNICLNDSYEYPFKIDSSSRNPFTGSYVQEKTSYDINGDDYIAGTEGKLNVIENVEGQLEFHYPFLGESSIAFTINGKNRLSIGTNPSTSNMLTFTGNSSVSNDLRSIYLNNLLIEIVDEDNGNLKVKVQFNNIDVTEDVRWCGEEVFLPPVIEGNEYSLNITNGSNVLIDWGANATRRANPQTINGILCFNDPSILRCIEDSYLHVDENSTLELDNQSTVILEDGGTLEIKDGSLLNVTNGSSFVLLNGSLLKVHGSGEIIIENDSYLCIEAGVQIELLDEESRILLKDGWINGVNPNVVINPTPDCEDICNIIISGNGEIIDESITTFYINQEIDQTTTWDSEQYNFIGDLIIEYGGVLNIQSSNLGFSKYSRIIIERGGVLNIDGSTISGLLPCSNTMWRGVEVWGNSDSSQYTPPGQTCAQGKIVLQNEAIIENARIAVDLWRPGYYNMTGGIIEASDAIFLNNAQAVHAIDYRNFNPYNPSQELDYYGRFNNCTFEINENYLGDFTFYKHADLDAVNGIKFRGCTFLLNNETDAIAEWNEAIAAYGAGFKVGSLCTQQISPCPPEYTDSSTFNGFKRAIGAYSTAESVHTFEVRNSVFDNNYTGIYASVTKDFVVVDCEFKVGYDEEHYDTCGFPNGYGIDAQLSKGFAIEDNYFTKNQQAPTGYYAGIQVYKCPSSHDIIYRNAFNGLSYGNYAFGINRSYPTDDGTGVEYQCNYNVNNAVDFIVTADEPRDAMIRGPQGSIDTACGNTFSPTASWHFRNEGLQTINWFFCPDDMECPAEEPDRDRIFTYDPLYFVKIEVDEFDCPVHYGSGGEIHLNASERQVEELLFAQNLANYTSVESLYQSLIDGGNTEAELLDIQAADPEDMWEMRAQLLGDSPHLSQAVLRAMSDRTDVFPDDVLMEILSANPDELSRDTLLDYLAQKEDPLPEYMIDILRQAAEGVTYKTILERELAQYHAAKTQAANNIIRSILHDSIISMADYRNWLDNIGGIGSDKQIIASYLGEGDTVSALTLLNMIPALYGLEGEELDAFNDYRELVGMQMAWKAAGKTVHDLDSTDIALLEIYANESEGDARAIARNILTHGYEHSYCECLHSDDSTLLKNVRGSITKPLAEVVGLKIIARPNPAGSWVAFDFEMKDDHSEGLIRVTENTGKVIQQTKVSGSIGQFVWDTRFVAKGTYIYTLVSNGFSKSGKLIIQ